MNVQATFAATLVDEWARCGVAHAVVSPGSRSTPLAVALYESDDIAVHVRLDERSAGFFAVGLALASGGPVALVTTSGTAAAELHPAVAEADQAKVPLIVCTADRPPELQHVRAPQTLDQTHLFGGSVRWFCQPGVADDSTTGSWRSLAARAADTALRHPLGAGPVHLNLAFREPLTGSPGALPPGRPDGCPWTWSVRPAARIGRGDADVVSRFLELRDPGVIVAGHGCSRLDLALALGERLSWPVLADPRVPGRAPARGLVTTADALLRCPDFVDAASPRAVLVVGDPPASKVVNTRLAGAERRLVVEPGWPHSESAGQPDVVVRCTPDDFLATALELAPGRTLGDGHPAWLAMWQRAEDAARLAIDGVTGAGGRLTEPAVAATVYASAPGGSALFVASSMPIRDLEWFAAPRPGAPFVYANRGVNGIDGCTSTALGVAAANPPTPTYALVGDLAFLHDLSGLVWGEPGPPPLTVVVVDNGGGGIFSFLPQANELDATAFEFLFGTRQSPDLAAVAAALGCRVDVVEDAKSLAEIVSEPPESGIRVVVARTDRGSAVADHARIHEAVRAAIRPVIA